MKKPITQKDIDSLRDKKTERLLAILEKLDHVSGQGEIPKNLVVNIADIIARKDEIEKELGEELDYGNLFKGLAHSVLNGGVIVMTDESTTGSAISVQFNKEVKF